MGFTFYKHTPLLTTIIASLFLGACSGTPEETSDEVEVKSINIFFSKENEAGTDVGKAYSFSPQTGKTLEIATVNYGEDSIAVLDTDEDAPGYEFAAFADGNTVKLLDYSKTATQRVYDLGDFGSTEICGVYPAKRPAFSVYEKESDYYLKTIDDTAVYVALKVGDSCSKATNAYHYINFNIPGFPLVSESRSSTSANAFGSFLFDSNYKKTNDNGEEITGRAIWIGHNKDTESLSGKVWDGPTLFEIPFTYKSDNKPLNTAETTPPYILTANNDRLVIQKNHKIYDGSQTLQNSYSTLYELSLVTLKSLLANEDLNSPVNPITEFLSVPFATIPNSAPEFLMPSSVNGNYISFEGTDALFRYRFDQRNIETIYTKEINNGLRDIRFSILDSGDTVVLKRFQDYESLTIIPANQDLNAVQAIASSTKLDFRTHQNRIYINALAPSNILNNSFSSSTWVTAEIETSRTILTLEGAILVFLDNPIEQGDIILLSPSATPIDEQLINPVAYKYDSSRASGIYSYDELEGEVLTKITPIDIGSIQATVTAPTNETHGANYTLNKDYAAFQVITDNAVEGYYFSPDQSTDSDSNRKPSLSLIKRGSNDNHLTINFTSVSESSSQANIEL